MSVVLLVILTASIFGSTGNSAGYMWFQVIGTGVAPSFPAIDATSLRVAGNNAVRASATSLYPIPPLAGLLTGTYTFRAAYKLFGSGSATFADRNIVVIPA